MAKKKTKVNRVDKAWKAFCALPRIDQYEMVYDEYYMFDNFENMLDSPEDHPLEEIEADLKSRKRANKKNECC